MARFWCLFFSAWPLAAVAFYAVGPSYGWWFHTPAQSPLGQEIDNLFFLIHVITSITFLGTTAALAYVLWTYSGDRPGKGWFFHGSHALEVIWTIAPAGILLFISLYQLDVWARYRMRRSADQYSALHPIAEVTARQFEWRIRYPHPSRKFASAKEVDNWLKHPAANDLYAVNDLHIPAQKPVMIHLRSEDVLHSFYIPDMRVKQDVVPGQVIPVWTESLSSKTYDLVCAELCGWGHYKMKGRVVAETEEKFHEYLHHLEQTQFDDGYRAAAPEGEDVAAIGQVREEGGE